MSDTRRELLALRTILVTGRAALDKTPSADDREVIKDRVTAMLAELEQAVIRDGANPEVLARLEASRRDVWD